MLKHLIYLSCLIIISLTFAGCGANRPQTDFVPVGADVTANQTDPAPVNATDTPVAARVNGQAILLADLETRVRQFQAVLSTDANSGQQQLVQIQQQVLDGLIDQAIINQAAQDLGIVISQEALNLKIEELKQGQTPQQFEAWLQLNNFDHLKFKETLRDQLIAAELFARIADQAPTTAEQVHARHILLKDPALAQDVISQIEAGESFVDLAQQLSEDESTAIVGGDLGWFPKGAQIVPPQVEEVVFSLPPGQISPVIESVLGFHIIRVERKEDNRPLTPQHRQILQANLFNAWLAQQRAAAQIERYVN